ncbi:MAG TPA: CopG family transcriptional regulator [Elusimicrobia bacterium]|nr:CopG family transcriptional regulator [Elusimicrobiota bacterium]
MFTLRLPVTVRKELEKISKQEKIPAGQIVRDAVDRYIAIKQFRNLRKIVLPFAEAQGLITDEDVFESLKK